MKIKDLRKIVGPFLFLREVCVRFLSFLSSSSEEGASLDKPSEMMAFSLSISQLG
jgi:hypothetical protein